MNSDELLAGPPPEPPRLTFVERHGIHPVLFAGLTLVFLFLLYQGIPAVVAIIIFGINIGQETKLVTPENVDVWRAMTGLSQILLLLLPTLALARLVTFSRPTFFHLRLPRLRLFLLPFIGILSLQQMLQLYLIVQDKIPLPDALERLNDQMKAAYEEATRLLTSSGTVPEFLWVILVIAIIPALAEEFLFRGLVQRTLEKGSTPWRAVIATGIIFGAYHVNPGSFVPLAVLGIYLGFLAMRADSLWVSVAGHFYSNAVACFAVFLHQDEDAILTGVPQQMGTMELLLSFWLFGVVFLVATYYFIHETRSPEPV
jgi:membrane protease YdiL (CAAX protease family)